MRYRLFSAEQMKTPNESDNGFICWQNWEKVAFPDCCWQTGSQQSERAFYFCSTLSFFPLVCFLVWSRLLKCNTVKTLMLFFFFFWSSVGYKSEACNQFSKTSPPSPGPACLFPSCWHCPKAGSHWSMRHQDFPPYYGERIKTCQGEKKKKGRGRGLRFVKMKYRAA